VRVFSTPKKGVKMSTIFHKGRKVLRENIGNPNYAEIADFLYFRSQISNYRDSENNYFYLLKNIDYLSEKLGFGHTLIKKALNKLEELNLIKKKRHKCYDGAVRLKIYITSSFKKLMSKIEELRTAETNITTPKEQPKNIDQSQNSLSDQTQNDFSYIKEQELESNNINTITDLNDIEGEKGLMDLSNMPNFTDDNTVLNTLQDLTDKQMYAIDTCAKHFKVDGCQLFTDVVSSIEDKLSYDTFNSLLGLCVNKQISKYNQNLEKEYQKQTRKYDIDYYAIDNASDIREGVLNRSQEYAIEQGLLYLQKRKGIKFDLNELKTWVSISLLNGYKQSGFRKAIRSILKSIEKGKYTKPWAMKYNV
jgi:predicted transcriptional regulator